MSVSRLKRKMIRFTFMCMLVFLCSALAAISAPVSSPSSANLKKPGVAESRKKQEEDSREKSSSSTSGIEKTKGKFTEQASQKEKIKPSRLDDDTKPTEKIRDADDEEDKGVLKLFGRDFFKAALEAFEPIPNQPVPDEYTLGPGDELEVVFSSRTGEESVYTIVVDAKGQVRIPNVGVVSVRGLRITEVESKLNKLIKAKFPQLTASASLTQLRAIQVFVAGETSKPGAYTLSGLSRVFNALYAAGGPSEVGSMRNIQLIRDNKTIATLDVYDYLLTGKRAGDLVLHSNDTVFIPVIGPTVTVTGEVRRPAIYELKGGETLGDVIRLAGGLGPTAYAKRIQLERVDGNEKRILLDIEAKESKSGILPEFSVKMLSGDTVIVLPVLEDIVNKIEATGKVKRPGEYQWREGMRVSDLIKAAEGLAEEEVYTRRAVVTRIRNDGSSEIITFDLAAALAGDDKENIILSAKDKLKVYSLSEAQYLDRTVVISGSVSRPGIYDRKENMTLRDLITLAGGALPEAYDQVEIAAAADESGKSSVRHFSLAKALEGSAEDNPILKDRDHVSIRSIKQLTRKPKTVTITGEVAFPGVYALENDEQRLSNLVERAGGLTNDAFPEGAIFSRILPFVLAESQSEIASNIESSMKALANQINELEMAKYGVSKSPPQPSPANGETQKIATATETLAETAKKIEKPEGDILEIKSREVEKVTKSARLPIDLRAVISNPGSESDLTLQDGDVLHIPRKPVVVSVAGAVVSPSLVFFEEGQPISYYIKQCGGYAPDAGKKDVVVIRANGKAFSADEVKNVELGDIIVVPTKGIASIKPKWEKWSETIRTLGSLALTFYVLGK